MSESGEEEEDEAWSREDDELIPRRTTNPHHSTDEAANSHQIPCYRNQDRSELFSTDLQKDSNTKNDKKEGFIKGNRRKLQEKAKQMLISPVGRLRKHLEGTKNLMTSTESRLLRSPTPFPYDGKDFGGSPSYRYLCFRPPSIPSALDSPRKDLGTAESPRGGGSTAVATAKPNHSSHYLFVKSLLEKNQFYSPECNPHREVTRLHDKPQ